MVLYYDAKAFMIEFKTSDGSQSAGQKEWAALVRSNGFQYHIIRSLPEFQSLILSILK
jgi:hypothetical protein